MKLRQTMIMINIAVIVHSQDGKTVGHVPVELSRLFHKFLINFGEIEAECIGSQYNAGFGKGLELPVDYKLFGNEKSLKDVVVKLKKIQNSVSTLNINISEIRRSDMPFRYVKCSRNEK